jgi:hypothetical protein
MKENDEEASDDEASSFNSIWYCQKKHSPKRKPTVD